MKNRNYKPLLFTEKVKMKSAKTNSLETFKTQEKEHIEICYTGICARVAKARKDISDEAVRELYEDYKSSFSTDGLNDMLNYKIIIPLSSLGSVKSDLSQKIVNDSNKCLLDMDNKKLTLLSEYECTDRELPNNFVVLYYYHFDKQPPFDMDSITIREYTSIEHKIMQEKMSRDFRVKNIDLDKLMTHHGAEEPLTYKEIKEIVQQAPSKIIGQGKAGVVDSVAVHIKEKE